VRGQQNDLHSGSFGGALHNPIQVLCEIIARLHDSDGRIAIPGFYERVRRLSAPERADMARDGPADAQILRDARAEYGWGEHGYSLYERTTIRPALTINGIGGGYQGPGGKGIIPARATAKLSFRLVPDQDPRAVEQLVRRHIARIAPPTVRVALRTSLGTWPALLDKRHPAFRAAAQAYRRAFGATPVFVRSGGSIPVVSMFQELLGIPTILMGFALPDDRMHAPNERFRLSQFSGGIATSIHFLAEAGLCWRDPSRRATAIAHGEPDQ
jgi:acetylornithine deacetylase/succinyl-diaminopimelate desuccinylase-like protein